MTQTVPATAVLGPGKTGLTIGLRVLNLDGTEYAAFSTTGVAETSTAGTYRKAGGVIAPLAGGYIVWGTALVDYAEATVESASANVTMQQGVAVAPADANGNVRVVLYGTQDAVTFGKITLDSRGYQPALQLVSPLPNAIYGATGLMVGLTSPGVAQITDAVPDAQDIADALLLAPSGAAAAGSVDAKLDDILTTIGSEIVEGTYTRDDILRIIAAALAGETSGSGTPTVTITGLDGATTRITATVDGNGNRTGMTLDGAA
jgi:hypothetical protein